MFTGIRNMWIEFSKGLKLKEEEHDKMSLNVAKVKRVESCQIFWMQEGPGHFPF